MENKLDPQVVNLAKAIRTVESNNNFTVRSKDGSYGAYQFIKPTWDATSKKYGVNAEWEKATPQQQNEVAYKQIADWKKKGYNVGQIASMWNAGEGKPDAYKEGLKGTNKDGVAYDVSAYAKKVAENYQKLKAQTTSTTTQEEIQPEVVHEKRDGFLKSLVKPIATMIARPLQLGAELLMPGDNTVELDKFSKEKLGGFVAPIPQNVGDLKKDVGRAVQTVAFGMPGLASGGAAFGVGASMEEGNDLFSVQTAFQGVLGAAGAKVLGLIGTPILNSAGKVIGKITPQVLKDVVSKGAGAITKFAAKHNILPKKMSQALTTGANKLEDVIAKPFDKTGQYIKKTFTKTPEKIIAAREAELAAIDNNYVNMRKASGFSKDSGAASRRRIAETDVLVYAVDENGLIRTKNAIKQYKAQTIDGAEGVVRNNLARLGETVAIKDIEKEMINAVNKSNIEGAELTTAFNGVKRELKGLKLRADTNGRIPLTLVHDAKIATTDGINYLTTPDIKKYKKAIASGLRKTVENNSKFNVKQVNEEIGKYLDDIAFLKRLDGKRVKGGKLGKYFAQISGNIIGGATGAMVGGIPGSAVGTVVGGELGGRIRGSMLKRALGGATGFTAPKNKIIDEAVALSKTPYSKSLGNLKAKYNTIKPPSKSSIKPIISPKTKGVNSEIGITSFRGKPVKTIGETAPYYTTTRAKGFENAINSTAKDFNIKIDNITRVAGSWEGSIEPSYSVVVKGSIKDKLAYAVTNAQKANQDAVILFTKGKGNGTKYSFENVKNPDKALKVLHSNGVSGATIYKNDIVVYDMDNSLSKKLKTFTSLTGNKPIKSNGKIQLIEKKDYAKYSGRGGDGNSVRSGKTSKITKNTSLTGEDARVQDAAILKYEKNPEKLLIEYRKRFGKNYASADEARKLFKDVGYNGANSNAVHEAASALNKDVWRYNLSTNKETYALLYSGMPGAGKSTAIAKIPKVTNILDDTAAILDGNLAKFSSAKSRIQEALKAEKVPTIVHIYRDPIDAFENGVIKRMLNPKSTDYNRVVPIKHVYQTAIGSRKALQEAFENAKQIGLPQEYIIIIDNSLGFGKAKEISLNELLNKKIPDNLESLLINKVKELYAKGTITKQQYEQFIR